MLMGIRPDRMQALAWGLSAGAAGIAGALMATSYPWSPSVGETFGLIAFVVVALGGFGSVPGSLYAGLIIGADPGGVGVLARRRSTRTSSSTACSSALLWFRPQGLLGKGVSVMRLVPRVAILLLAAALLLYPLVLPGAFYRDIGVTLLLAAIAASAWNIVGGYAGQVSVGHSMFFGLGAYAAAAGSINLWGWPPLVGIPVGIALSVALAVVDRPADLPAARTLFQHGDDRGRRAHPHLHQHLGFRRRRDRPAGPGDARAAGGISPSAAQLPYYYIFLAVLALLLLVTWR